MRRTMLKKINGMDYDPKEIDEMNYGQKELS